MTTHPSGHLPPSVKNSLHKLVPQGMLSVMEGGMDKPIVSGRNEMQWNL